MNGEQIRAASARLGWTSAGLAKASGNSYPTIQRIDAAKGLASGKHDRAEAIRRALEAQGVQLLESDQVAAGPGVALRAKA